MPGNDNVKRVVLLIAVAVASYFTAGWAAGAYGASVGSALGIGATAGAGLVTAVVQTAVFAVGMLAINALVPLNSDFSNGDNNSQSLNFIGSARNRLEPYGTVPMLLGYHRITPPQCALPYTDLRGQDEYVTMMFALSYRRLMKDKSTAKLGDTKISKYKDVEIEYDTGDVDNDQEITLYRKNQVQEAVNQEIRGTWITRAVAPNSKKVRFDLLWKYGLIKYDRDDEGRDPWETSLEIEIREQDTGDTWAPVKQKTWFLQTAVAFRREISVSNLDKTKLYDIRIRAYWVKHPLHWPPQNGDDDPGGKGPYNIATLTTLHYIQNGTPVSNDCIALAAMEIRATDQLNGIPDTFNIEAQSRLHDWDGSHWDDHKPTSNPASCLRFVLGVGSEGCATARPLTVSRINDASFIAFHDWCVLNNFEFCQYIDFSTTVHRTINQIAAVGRARVYPVDGKWTVVIDKKNDVISQYFTPRNTISFSASKVYPDEIHAMRVRFISRVEGWQNSEMIVFADGYNEDGSGGDTEAVNYEGIQFDGVTDPDHNWKLARYWLKVAKYQAENFTIETDVENLVSLPGDRVAYQDEALLTGIGTARVVSYIGTTLTLDDGFEFDDTEANDFYGFTIRPSDGSAGFTFSVDTPASPSSVFNGTATGTVVEGDLAIFGVFGIITQDLLIKSITPGQDLTAVMECVPYNEAVYDVDDETAPTYDPGVTLPLTDPWPTIEQIRSDETVMILDGNGTPQPTMAVTIVNNTADEEPLDTSKLLGIALEWRVYIDDPDASEGPWLLQTIAPQETTGFIIGVTVGTAYEVRVSYIFNDGSRSNFHTITHTVIGNSDVPDEVSSFTILNVGSDKHYSWVYDSWVTTPIVGYEIRYMSYVEAGGLPNAQHMEDETQILAEDDTVILMEEDAPAIPAWEDMHKVSTQVIIGSPHVNSIPVEALASVQNYHFAIKAVNSSGNLSPDGLYITKDIGVGAPA
ncbi:hypothetical protein DRQ25_16280 [Candidatus Fermentibacteria bacterium]|nr:MAG: hypothetical protein DRQ25_16280 [Candidatus Fermentibacteria bacterium]